MQQSPDVGISIAHPGTRGQRFEAMFPKTSQFLNKESPASPSILHDFPGIIVNFFHLCYEDFFLTVSGRHDKMDPLSTKCKCVDGEKTIFFCVQRADTTKLRNITDRVPLAYSLLGNLYYEPDENGKTDKKLAVEYYMKAEEHAILDQRGASRVLDYYRDGGDIQLTEDDVKRLELIVRP